MVLYVKRGDLEPSISVVLDDAGTPVDLTVATAVRFLMTDAAGAVIVDRAMTKGNQTTDPGLVTMAWQAADTDAAGVFSGEVEVMWPGNRPQTFPGNGYLNILILADLG